MTPLRILTLCAAALLAAGPAMAQQAFYEDHPDRGLRFADLEFAMPTDPLLPSWASYGYVVHTPAQYLADATARLRQAIPAGTAAADAVAVLTRAGARCAQPAGPALTCRYRDVETPWGGEYFDSVTWTVTLPLVDGRVADLAVTRDWKRR